MKFHAMGWIRCIFHRQGLVPTILAGVILAGCAAHKTQEENERAYRDAVAFEKTQAVTHWGLPPSVNDDLSEVFVGGDDRYGFWETENSFSLPAKVVALHFIDGKMTRADFRVYQKESMKGPSKTVSLVWPHRNRPLPMFEGQELHLTFERSGRIKCVGFGSQVVSHWRMNRNWLEVIVRKPPGEKSSRPTMLHLMPDKIGGTLLDGGGPDIMDGDMTLTEAWGLVMIIPFAGPGATEPELLFSKSPKETFEFKNPTPMPKLDRSQGWQTNTDPKAAEKIPRKQRARDAG